MEKITWNEGFSVGVRSLDEQHKRLIAMINRLIQADDAQTDSEVVSEILDAMMKYAGQHFQTEEDLLAAHGCPLLAQQQNQHRDYVKKTVQFCQAAMLNVPGVPPILLNYLREWWTQHIQEEDKQYTPFLAAKGVR